jgi:hypothetical protein
MAGGVLGGIWLDSVTGSARVGQIDNLATSHEYGFVNATLSEARGYHRQATSHRRPFSRLVDTFKTKQQATIRQELLRALAVCDDGRLLKYMFAAV